MKSQLFLKCPHFFKKNALLLHSTPVDPQTQNPLESIPVDPLTPNSLYSALAEREHKTRARDKTCMRAVNRQPKFTARGTRRAFSPRARTGPLQRLESKRLPRANFCFFMKSLLFHEISTVSRNVDSFMKSRLVRGISFCS